MKKIDIIMLVIASRGIEYDSMINNYWSKMINYSKIHNRDRWRMLGCNVMSF